MRNKNKRTAYKQRIRKHYRIMNHRRPFKRHMISSYIPDDVSIENYHSVVRIPKPDSRFYMPGSV